VVAFAALPLLAPLVLHRPQGVSFGWSIVSIDGAVRLITHTAITQNAIYGRRTIRFFPRPSIVPVTFSQEATEI
jgi:hypothetical protein